MAAAAEVFGTNELLEHILNYVGGLDAKEPIGSCAKDVARAQQVCTQWRKVIDCSPFLRQVLFIDPASVTQFLDRNYPGTWENVLCQSHDNSGDGKMLTDVGIFNPRLPVNVIMSGSTNTFEIAVDALRRLESTTFAEAFVTQPPFKRLEMMPPHGWWEVEATNGVKIKDLIERLEQIKKDSKASLRSSVSFSITGFATKGPFKNDLFADEASVKRDLEQKERERKEAETRSQREHGSEIGGE